MQIQLFIYLFIDRTSRNIITYLVRHASLMFATAPVDIAFVRKQYLLSLGCLFYVSDFIFLFLVKMMRIIVSKELFHLVRFILK